jgi:hypothetical protein
VTQRANMDWMLGPTVTVKDPWVLFGMTKEEWEARSNLIDGAPQPLYVWEVSVQD